MRPRRRLPGDQLADGEPRFGVGDTGENGGGESGRESASGENHGARRGVRFGYLIRVGKWIEP
jgi:hypothetical protein